MQFYKKRGEIHSRVFIYILAIIIAAFILLFGSKSVSEVREKACKTRLVVFETDLRGSMEGISLGSIADKTYDVPCGIEKIFFVDMGKNIPLAPFGNYPIIKDAIGSKVRENVFLIKGGNAEEPFYAGDLEIEYPHYKCFSIVNEKLELFLEGHGAFAKIRHKYNYTDCAESVSTVIAHTPISQANASSPIGIIADIEYAGTNPDVLVVYRKDDGSWQSALMALDSGTNENGTWKGQIPAYSDIR